MPLEERSRSRQPFLDALHSEILAGSENLNSWIRQLEARGAIEHLFGLETWLKGMRSFFSLENLPLTEQERRELPTRDFSAEVSIMRKAVETCDRYGCAVLGTDAGVEVEFEHFIDIQMRRHRIQDFNISRIAEQLTPADSISRLVEFLNDIRITIDAFGAQDRRLDCRLFLSLGRTFVRELRSCRYVDMLMSQRFRLQYDSVDNKAVSAALRLVPREFRRDTALTILFLLRFLKYLRLISAGLKLDRPLKQYLVLFALLNEEMKSLSESIRTRFLKNRETGHALQNAAELISYSLRVEAQRVMRRELIMLQGESDPGAVYTRVENSHGLLRNCCRSCITTLVQSVDPAFDAAALFPSRSGELVASEKLRQDLWNLRRYLKDVIDNREELNPTSVMERLISFKEGSLRFLMYRDWAEFEAFSDALAVSGNFLELRTQIRKFTDFLETLIQEVSKRSVFQQSPQS